MYIINMGDAKKVLANWEDWNRVTLPIIVPIILNEISL